MSGGGDIVKGVGNYGSSIMTGGAYSTNGKGWAQGGSLKDVANNFTGGVAGKVMDHLNPKVDVPDATARPEWMLSGEDGKLRSDLLLGNTLPVSATQSQETLSKLLEQANSKGPTDQAKYLQEANTRNMQNNLGQAEELGRGNMASMTGQLASRGGVDAGSRERLAKSTGMSTMMNKQKIMNDAAGANLDILAKDEASKLDTMRSLPSSLLQQAGFEQGQKQFDISNTLNTVGGKYNTDMSAWGANQAAREQAQLANKKSGVFGLGIGGIL